MQNETWQAKVNGEIFECEFPELEKWIAESILLPQDVVRRGQRGWIEAGRVPILQKLFENQGVQPLEVALATTQTVLPSHSFPVTTVIEDKIEPQAGQSHYLPLPSQPPKNILAQPEGESVESAETELKCHFHAQETAAYVCSVCSQAFCKNCPKAYGTVRICPLCGEMCRPYQIVKTKVKSKKIASRTPDLQKAYGLTDFAQAWIYPFKFWQSLIMGALFVALLSFGGFFGNLLANAILFGCIAQAISSMAHGDYDRSFMPDFDGFNVLDDVLKPFLLSAGVLLVAFLPALLLMVTLFFNVLISLTNPATAVKAEQENAVAVINGSPSTRILVEQQEPGKQQSTENLIANVNDEQTAAQRKVQELARSVGSTPLEQQSGWRLTSSLIKPIYDSPFAVIALLSISLVWGIIYLPMALAIAGYTNSFTATINPLVGIGAMWRMGLVYPIALVFCLTVQFSNLLLATLVGYLTAPFELPLIGNLPGKLIIGMISFYLSLVIAFLLGTALYKTADRLEIKMQ